MNCNVIFSADKFQLLFFSGVVDKFLHDFDYIEFLMVYSEK